MSPNVVLGRFEKYHLHLTDCHGHCVCRDGFAVKVVKISVKGNVLVAV